MSDMDAPEFPQPEKAAPEDRPKPEGEPTMNGSGRPQVQAIDNAKLIQWIEATDKELARQRVMTLVLCGAVLFLIATSAKGTKLPTP